MTLGQKVRAARMERSLTQKQLVGDQITRNMLSKIENDSATPSVRTLEYLASRLGLPAGYFLSELQEAPDEIPDGLSAMRKAYREGRYKDCMKLLDEDREACATDEGFLLRSKSACAAAHEALAVSDYDAAKEYADDADYYNKQGIYYSAQIDAEMSLILAECALAVDISEFEENEREYLRAVKEISYAQRYRLAKAEFLLRSNKADEAAAVLDAIGNEPASETSAYLYLRGRIALDAGDTAEAAKLLGAAEDKCAPGDRLMLSIYSALEAVYNSLEDYRLAYKYASMQLRARTD